MKISDKVFEYIDALAEKLGVAAEHVYGVMLRQVIIEGVVYLSVMVLGTVGLVAAVIFFVKNIKRIQIEKGEEFDLDAHAFGWMIGAIVFSICTFVSLLITAMIGPEQILKLSNPEYYVIQEILSVFK